MWEAIFNEFSPNETVRCELSLGHICNRFEQETCKYLYQKKKIMRDMFRHLQQDYPELFRRLEVVE